MAKRLGVAPAWLRQEAEEGRIPCLVAGHVLLFDVVAVESALSERAASPAKSSDHGRECHCAEREKGPQHGGLRKPLGHPR